MLLLDDAGDRDVRSRRDAEAQAVAETPITEARHIMTAITLPLRSIADRDSRVPTGIGPVCAEARKTPVQTSDIDAREHRPHHVGHSSDHLDRPSSSRAARPSDIIELGVRQKSP
jgi:hypothetical protein